jgi:hypothetical protein
MIKCVAWWLDCVLDRELVFRFPATARDFSLFLNVQSNYGVRPVSCSLDTRGILLRGKVAGTWGWLDLSSARVSVGGAALYCPIYINDAGSTNPTTCDYVSKYCIPCYVNPVMCSSLCFVFLPRRIRHIPAKASIPPVVLHVLPLRNLRLWKQMSEGGYVEIVTVLVAY